MSNTFFQGGGRKYVILGPLVTGLIKLIENFRDPALSEVQYF